MARVFANDVLKECEKQGIHSRYDMIILAAHRARNLNRLAKNKLILPAEEYLNVSKAVTVLREIETGNLDMHEIKEDYLQSYTSIVETSIEEVEKTDQKS